MTRIVSIFIFLISIVATIPSQIRTEADFYQGYAVVAREAIVKFRPATRESLARVMRDFDIVATEGAADVVLLRSWRQDVGTLIRGLAARPEVEYAEPNYIYRTTDTPQAQSIPNDPNLDVLYGLNNKGQPIRGTAGVNDADIDAPEAWNYTTGST